MISFGNSPGNLFNILGKLGALVKNVKSHQTTQKTSLIDTTAGVVAQLNAESDLQSLIGSAYISTLSGVEGASNLAASVASQVIQRIVFRDNPQLGQNLTSGSNLISLQEIIRQMKAEGATVLAMTVTGIVQAAGGSPGPHFAGTGNGILNISTKRPLDGLTLENTFGETLTALCTADSYTGNATPFNEQITISGQGNESDFFAFDWPLGSNASTSVSTIDGDTSNGSGNLLQNSNFSTYVNTPNVPDQWVLALGVAGTNVAQNTGVTYSGGSSLQIIGDGTTQTELDQQFNSSAGTSSTLSPQTQYSHCIFLVRDGIAAGQGTLQIALVDGSGNVINDNAGNPNSYNIDLTALGTTFTQFTGAFRTPTILPAVYKIRMKLTTPLTNGRSVFLGKSSLGQMSQLYTSGPFVACHAGNIPFVQNDRGTILVTNSRGAGGTLSTFQTLMAQFFTEMISSELLLSSSATPSISDGLIA